MSIAEVLKCKVRGGLLATAGILAGVGAYSQNGHLRHPFPNHTSYAKGAIKPQTKQASLDNAVKDFYTQWKLRYVKNDCSNPGLYYVYTDEGDTKNGVPVVCVSEGQGFGMMIIPLMAGYDKNAQRIYDGMYRFVVAHPTAKSKDLMSWSILRGCRINHQKNGDEYDNTSATDGDLDIALSLFMADAQWGSKGAINYRAEGIKRATAILRYEVNKQKHTLLLSDANDPGDYDFFDIRTSDFMPTHLKVFNKYCPNAEWGRVVDRTYQIFLATQKKYSPKAGLIPDFITYRAKKYVPAKPHYLESADDGTYSYNACRVPFRLGLDFLLTGDVRAKQVINPMIAWLQASTKGDFKRIYAGYRLSGAVGTRFCYPEPAFVSPFVVGGMLNGGNQQWLNRGYSYMGGFAPNKFHYYSNTINLLSLLVISGNFWLP
ncbi:glycosyl hydrolase family 8 [uncultured Acetobacteroides sp.]|uniref:glycosyl hydrolase family 8 n=1 Tax=uncultured Acetobacteroides sp. TaxID=1760811 RepID=UPI0029F4D1F2|nr:glycosyl hydrolase family 8 [uncultured Acetobacteroides sp.]